MQNIKTIIPAEIRPGVETGIISLINAPTLEQPSILPASSRSLGIVLKYPYKIQVDIGNSQATYPMTSPYHVLSR